MEYRWKRRLWLPGAVILAGAAVAAGALRSQHGRSVAAGDARQVQQADQIMVYRSPG